MESLLKMRHWSKHGVLKVTWSAEQKEQTIFGYLILWTPSNSQEIPSSFGKIFFPRAGHNTCGLHKKKKQHGNMWPLVNRATAHVAGQPSGMESYSSVVKRRLHGKGPGKMSGPHHWRSCLISGPRALCEEPGIAWVKQPFKRYHIKESVVCYLYMCIFIYSISPNRMFLWVSTKQSMSQAQPENSAGSLWLNIY